MSILTARRIDVLMSFAGVILFPLFLFAGFTTLRLCRDVEPDLLGIDFSRARLLGIDFQTITLSWYDGCNWHGTPLLPLLIALGLILGGLLVTVGVTIHKHTSRDTT